MTFIILGFLVLAVVAVVANTVQQNRRMNQSWQLAATQLGLRVDPGGRQSKPSMRGHVGRVSVVVVADKPTAGYTYLPGVHVGVSGAEMLCTSYTVTYPTACPRVIISKQGSKIKVPGWSRQTGVEIGNPDFDERFIIDSDDPQQMREYLTPARQAAVLQVFSGWTTAAMTQNEIKVASVGLESDPAMLQLVAIAEVMGRPG